MKSKTHYRQVFKSDHLGIADLEDFIEEKKTLVFTIKEVKQEYGIAVAGRKGDHNIAYFVEKIKPLVLNATNSKAMKKFNGGSPFVEDWKNTVVELYIDANVKMKGEVVGGVRIRTVQPKIGKPALVPGTKEWEAAKAYLAKDGTIPKIRSKYGLSVENEKKLIDETEI